MIELQDNQLIFRFPQVHPQAEARIEFQRTLRIPDDNREYPLPAGLGRFPLDHVDDFHATPGRWKAHGGVLMPIWQAEAAWINFHGSYPMAIKIAAGKINAVTGEAWTNELCNTPQDYVVTPGQYWLDGFYAGEGLIRQFVAMPLGEDVTAEEQMTGEAEHGGLQIIAYPMRAEIYNAMERERQALAAREERTILFSRPQQADMGMAPGGLMRQQIYDDHHGIDAWEQAAYSRCFVHLVNARHYKSLTGHIPPHKPPKAHDYQEAGLPWFDYYRADAKQVGGPSALMKLDSLAAKLRKKGKSLADNQPVSIADTVQLGDPSHKVREGW